MVGAIALAAAVTAASPIQAPAPSNHAPAAAQPHQLKKPERTQGNAAINLPIKLPRRNGAKPVENRPDAADNTYNTNPKQKHDAFEFVGLIMGGLVGCLTVAVLGFQTLLMTRQSARADAEYIAAHRPKLRVRNVSLHGVWRSGRLGRGFVAVMRPGQSITGKLYVANIGGTPANIISSHCEIYWSNQGIPGERLYEKTAPTNFIKGTIGMGDVMSISIKSARLTITDGASGFYETTGFDPDETPVKADVPDPGGLDYELYVLGKVLYQDDRGVPHETAFCRVYDPRIDQFRPVENPDYEYEE